ncbi:FAD:protein FMN transferase [Clostridium sp.]|uniref:FAD:protein FMN transferase n=1 Tax=Clostridium sp. TaxID=1506 RepID=UPI0026232004|nr:FAD:protein FMN transferase [Clostridium sp.]
MKKTFNYISLSILLIFSLSILGGCTKKQENKEPLSRSDLLMGTVIKVTMYDSTDESILDDIFNKIKDIESKLSINENGTLLDKINTSAGIEPIKVDDDTYEVIKSGLEYSEVSNGLFDITIGPLVKLWSIGLPEQKLPTKEEIDSKLPLINYNDIILDDANKTVSLKRSGMILDLGGIAKGFTADIISELLTARGVKSAIIDLGGNIFAHGNKNKDDLWKIGIQNPLSERGGIIGSIKVQDKSIVTSGIYERYFEENGIRYHHILNPKTGYPYENNIAGITIVSDKSIDGDALSTSVFAMGLEHGLDFINSRNGIDAIFVTKDNKIYLSNGIKDNFNLSNEDFIIQE